MIVHMCDSCYTEHSGSVQVVPGRLVSDYPIYCHLCTSASAGGIDVVPLPESTLQFSNIPSWFPVPVSE
jgi:hypothetical protein